MSLATQTRLTAAEFAEWTRRPENLGRHWELDAGEVVEMPPPGEWHGVLCALLAHWLWSWILQRGQGGHVCVEAGLVVSQDPDTVRGPDVMVFTEPRSREAIAQGHATHCPALVVEVLSPDTRGGAVLRKITQYLHRGIPLVWVIDSEGECVHVYRAGQPPETLEGDVELTGADVLPGFRCRVADLFQLPGSTGQPS